VVNCLLAAYPPAVFARDNSGCTPLDILNGTGKMMDHDAVVAALSRTISVLTKEEQEWNARMKSMEKEFRSDKEQKQRDYERMVHSKNEEIEALRRELEQEKLATSNLAKKVIQTEKVVQLKSSLETRYQERLKKCEEDIKTLKTLNAQRKAKIKEIEAVTECDKKNIEELHSRVQHLQAQLTAVCDDEESFVATTVARAEAQMQMLMEAQMAFMKEHQKKKERLRGRVGRLGITLPPKKFPSDFDEAGNKTESEREQHVDEPTDEEVAEKAMAAAMAHFSMGEVNND
jgi:chromosome segregation ATPase